MTENSLSVAWNIGAAYGNLTAAATTRLLRKAWCLWNVSALPL